ncbi:hypothetical protein [Pararobbsia silviterrae]|uniref:hypothetical protein n=1 Tax=Pararobbsia silviterrae TaxID=1792498 RepID=UPI0011C37B55|nr:hypothetical protein [Pararobbsia silviterrae]
MTPPIDEQVDGQGIFPADFGPQTALTCGPITLDDYRRALLDLTNTARTTYLFRNVQIFPLNSTDTEKPSYDYDYVYYYDKSSLVFTFVKPEVGDETVTYYLRGNYRLYVEPMPGVWSADSDAQAVLSDFLLNNRNLCESVSQVNWTSADPIVPVAEIEVEAGVHNYADIQAQLYSAACAYISPAVSHVETATLLDQGLTAQDIYQGPYLEHGWQPQLPAQTDYTHAVVVNLSGLAEKWMEIDGVKRIHSLTEASATATEPWIWQTAAPGQYPLPWGADLASFVEHVRLVTADGTYVSATADDIAAALPPVVIEDNSPVVLPYGKPRDVAQYHPVSDKIPPCYGLQLQPEQGAPLPLFQYLLAFEQAMANGCAQLSMLPKLLSFERTGDTVWGEQWPYAAGSAGDAAHTLYKSALIAQSASLANDYDQELRILDDLLGYFGTERASRMLDTTEDDFLSVEQSYLKQITTLAYSRDNIRIDQVSALQKRIAARLGLGPNLFVDPVDMGELPFYLVEHRALLPVKPSADYDVPTYPTTVTVSDDGLIMTVVNPATPSLANLKKGQLIDFVLYAMTESRITLQALIVDTVDANTQTFTLRIDENPVLDLRVDAVLTAQAAKDLTWQACKNWLEEILYRLQYASDTPSSPVDPVTLTIPESFPFPAGVRIGDTLSIVPFDLTSAETPVKVTVQDVDGIQGTVTVARVDSSDTYPLAADAANYVWYTLNTADRFSMIVSLVLDKTMLPANGDPYATEAWIKQCVQEELPAHVALMIHWLTGDSESSQSFESFAICYASWQDGQTAPSTATWQLLWKLGLGTVPVKLNTGIGSMKVATPDERAAAVGADGTEWNADYILVEYLFFVPKGSTASGSTI